MPVSSPPDLAPTEATALRNGDAINGIVQKLWPYCHVLRDGGL